MLKHSTLIAFSTKMKNNKSTSGWDILDTGIAEVFSGVFEFFIEAITDI